MIPILSDNTKPDLHPVNFYSVSHGKYQLTGGTSIALKKVLFSTKRYNLIFVPEGGRKRVVTTEFVEILVPDGFRYLPQGLDPDTDLSSMYARAKDRGLVEDEGDHEAIRVCWNNELEGHVALRPQKMRYVLFDPEAFPSEGERVILAWNDRQLRNQGNIYYE